MHPITWLSASKGKRAPFSQYHITLDTTFRRLCIPVGTYLKRGVVIHHKFPTIYIIFQKDAERKVPIFFFQGYVWTLHFQVIWQTRDQRQEKQSPLRAQSIFGSLPHPFWSYQLAKWRHDEDVKSGRRLTKCQNQIEFYLIHHQMLQMMTYYYLLLNYYLLIAHY